MHMHNVMVIECHVRLRALVVFGEAFPERPGDIMMLGLLVKVLIPGVTLIGLLRGVAQDGRTFY